MSAPGSPEPLPASRVRPASEPAEPGASVAEAPAPRGLESSVALPGPLATGGATTRTVSAPTTPFQKSRSSTISVELQAPSPAPVRPVLAFRPASAGAAARRSNLAAVAGGSAAIPPPPCARDASDAFAPYHPALGSLGADGSCRWPPDQGRAARSTVEAGGEERFFVTQWLGSPSLGAPLLRVRDLRYPWRRRARSGVTVEEIASRTRLRPDLARVLKVYHAGGMEEASSVLRRLMTEGDGAGSQLPEELPGDGTFAYSDAEVQYVDRMGWFLFGPGQDGSRRFVLPEVTGLYVFPRPYVYAKYAVALQKSSCSLMRLHAVGFSHRDWSIYRHREERDGRVVPSAAFASGLAPGDFAALPTDFWDAFPSLGVHPLLPPS